MFSKIKSDIRCVLERDPAARNAWDVVTCYPGFHALVFHRWAHWCWLHHLKWFGRSIAYWNRWLTGIEIHPGAKIGCGVFFDHAMGLVVGETAEIGDGCTLYQGVTLGGTSLEEGIKRHPTLGKNVVVSAGAKVLGDFIVGDNAKIGANAVVLKPVPEGTTAVGIPARIIWDNDRDGGIGEKDPMHERKDKEEKSIKSACFNAYGVMKFNNPIERDIQEVAKLVDNHERQINLLWCALEKLMANGSAPLGGDAQEALQQEKSLAHSTNKLLDKE